MDGRELWTDSLKQLDRALLAIREQLEQTDLARARVEIDDLCERLTHVSTRIGGEAGKLLSPNWKKTGVVVTGAFDMLSNDGVLTIPAATDLGIVIGEFVRFLHDGTTAFKQAEIAADVRSAINRYLSERGFAVGANSSVLQSAQVAETTEAMQRLLRMYTANVADDRIKNAASVLASNGTVNEKLERLDAALKIPATASAQKLADLLSSADKTVSKTAVINSRWWQRKRAGQGEKAVEQRRERLKARGQRYERDSDDD